MVRHGRPNPQSFGREAHMKRVIGAIALALSTLGACTTLNQIACVPTLQTRWLLEDLTAGGGPSELKRQSAAPTRTLISYTVGTQTYQGDLYTLDNGVKAGLVLVPGATTAGKDDSRLVAFANTLARSHFAVLVPDLPEVRQLRVRPEDAKFIADAAQYMSTRPDLAPGGRLGIAGLSYALGPGILAACDPAVRDKVRFVMGIGGYYDLEKVVTFFLTGWFQDPAGAWRQMEPSAYGKWAFIRSNAPRFGNASDAAVLQELADRRFNDPQSAIDDLTAKLQTPEAKAFVELITNTDPAKVPTLLAGMPAPVRADLDGLNLAKRDLSGFRAHLILVHGYDDNLVPYSQSVELARAIAGTRLYLVNGLSHVDLKGPGFLDVWGMGCAVNDLLEFQGP